MVFDLANDLLYCTEWDPYTLPLPYVSILPGQERLNNDIPFGIAEEADVLLDLGVVGGMEGLLGNGAVAILDAEDNQPMVK